MRSRLGFRLALAGLVALAGAWLALRTITTPYVITSGSMSPTLAVEERVSVDAGSRAPSIGDIVAFHAPQGATPDTPVCGMSGAGIGTRRPCGLPTPSSMVYVKRIIAGPGDRIAIVHGHVWRNGRPVSEPYASTCSGDTPLADCEFPQAITVPRGDVFLLGDNRFISDDSRYWGPIPTGWIVGTVVRCSVIGTICHPRR